MAVTNGNRKILDLKRWEMICPNPNGNLTDGSFISSSRLFRQLQFFYYATTSQSMYDPFEDGWVFLPNGAVGGSGGVGACGTTHSWSTGTSIGAYYLSGISGTVSSITTNQPLARSLSGFEVLVMEGPNAGSLLEIKGNTLGPSSTVYFDTQVSSFDSTTRYRLITPRWYVLGGGTQSTTSFKVYDFATNTWVPLTTTASPSVFPASLGTDSRLIATPSQIELNVSYFHTFNASSADASSIVDGNANWASGQWINSQVRIVSGTGAGQFGVVYNNNSNTLFVSSVTSAIPNTWSIAPSTDSKINIEGNDDYLYYIGNNNIALYRYRISQNRWELVTPTVARAAAPGAALGGNWIWEVTDPTWTDSNNIKNGRYIYSFRGGGTALLDIYDIAANSWTSNVLYSPGWAGATSGTTDTLTTGSKYCYTKNSIYISKESTGRFFRFDILKNEMVPWGYLLYPQSTARVGDTMWDVDFIEGNTTIKYIYLLLNSTTAAFRCMVI